MRPMLLATPLTYSLRRDYSDSVRYSILLGKRSSVVITFSCPLVH
jgi:hypothetical protein